MIEAMVTLHVSFFPASRDVMKSARHAPAVAVFPLLAHNSLSCFTPHIDVLVCHSTVPYRWLPPCCIVAIAPAAGALCSWHCGCAFVRLK